MSVIFPEFNVFDHEILQYMVIVESYPEGRLIYWTYPMTYRHAVRYLKHVKSRFEKFDLPVICRILDVDTVFNAIKDLPSLP